MSTTHAHELPETDPFHKGDRIRKVRELTGYSEIQEFAAVTGIDRGSLGKYETTGNVPRKSTLLAISMMTGARVEWLETGTGSIWGPTGPKPRAVTFPYQRKSTNWDSNVSQMFPTVVQSHKEKVA